MKNPSFLHIIIPQGQAENKKKEPKFQELLLSLRNTVTGASFSFEYLGKEQYTYFYITCESRYKETVEGLIYSIYPEAEIVVTDDYSKKIALGQQGISGCELILERQDVYPVRTYEQFEEDSMSRLFSVISKIAPDEQVWVQIVSNPEDDSGGYHFWRNWRLRFARWRQFFSIRDRIREGGIKTIAGKRYEATKEKEESKPFRTTIRCVYVAKNVEIAQQKLHAVTNSFYHFNDSDINSFTKTKNTSGEPLLRAYQTRKPGASFILSAKELATLYHFPNADHVSHIVHVLARKSDPPHDLPRATDKEVSAFGVTNYHNNQIPFGILRKDRRRHLYAVGKSGSGKSKMLELLIQNDVMSNKGFAVLDPHGDLVDNILKIIPEDRINDVILFDPADTEYPIAFNALEGVDEAYKMQLTIGFLDIFKKLFGDNWTYRLEHVLRYTTLALLDSPNTTVLSILKMLTDKNYRQQIVSKIKDDVVKNFWTQEFAAWSQKFDSEAITPLLNKVGQLVATNMIRNIIGQPQTKFNIRDVMDNKKILLMKVSKGLLGEENSSLIGAMIITKMYQAAMSRADIPEEQREDFYFYVDEFQNFATDTFYEILSEARKYRLNLTIAHQYMGQLSSKIRQTVFGNVGSMVNFRVGAEDAKVLAEEYAPIFTERDIINLGVREFYTKMSINGEIREAFSGRTMDAPEPKQDFTKDIIALSRQRYCKPRAEVEAMLKKWDESGDKTFEDLNSSAPEFEEPLI